MTTLRTPLSSADTAWLRVERRENPMVITAVLQLGGTPDPGRLRELVQQRLVDRYPVFGRRLAGGRRWPLLPAWEPDPHVDLAHHVVALDVEGELDEPLLNGVVGDLMGRPLDGSRPLWQLHVVRGRGAGSAVVARVHHSLADGIALAGVLLSLTDAQEPADDVAPDDAVPDQAAGRHDPAPSSGRSAPQPLALLGAAVGTFAQVVGYAVLPRRDPHGRLRAQRTAAWTPPHDLARVKAAAGTLGCSINDLLLAATAGGLRSHLHDRGERPHDVRVLVPANLRPASDSAGGGDATLGNRFGIVLVRLPVGRHDRRARLLAVTAATAAAKSGDQAPGTFVLLNVVGALPRWIARLAGRLVGAAGTAVVTNVPGPRHGLALAGCDVDSVVFWVPQVGSIGLGISLFTYAGGVTVGVTADRGLDVDAARLAAAIAAELDALVTTAEP